MNMIFSKTKWRINNSIQLPQNNIIESNKKNTAAISFFQKGILNKIQTTSQCMNCKIYK